MGHDKCKEAGAEVSTDEDGQDDTLKEAIGYLPICGRRRQRWSGNMGRLGAQGYGRCSQRNGQQWSARLGGRMRTDHSAMGKEIQKYGKLPVGATSS